MGGTVARTRAFVRGVRYVALPALLEICGSCAGCPAVAVGGRLTEILPTTARQHDENSAMATPHIASTRLEAPRSLSPFRSRSHGNTTNVVERISQQKSPHDLHESVAEVHLRGDEGQH